MERKLYDAAAALPQPETKFDAIRTEADARRPAPKIRRFNVRRAIALAAALVLVFTFVAAGYRYDQIQRSMWVLYYEHDWDSAQHAIEKFDLTLPQELAGYQFYYQNELSVVPKDTPLVQAMVTDFFRPIEIQYAHFLTMEEINEILAAMDEAGSISGVQEWGPSIVIGSTDSPYWQYYFSIGEDGLVSREHVVPGSMEVVTYKEITIQLFLTEFHYDEGHSAGPLANALWVDEARECCILLDSGVDDMTAALTMAQQLIDTNP